MCASKSLTGLLMMAAFAVAADDTVPWPRSIPIRLYRPNMGPKHLIEHVMAHEKQWTNVLQEPIKGIGGPPYVGRAFPAPPIAKPAAGHVNGVHDDGTTFYDVREIVATVVTHYRSIRSFVEYAAKAVRRAFSCYTFRHVLFHLNVICLMMIKKAPAIDVLAVAEALKKNSATYIDLLSAAPDDDLTALLRLYWEAVNVTQYENIQFLKEQPYPEPLVDDLRVLSRQLLEFIGDQCRLDLPDDDIYEEMGIWKHSPIIEDDDLILLLKVENLEKMAIDHAVLMNRYANELQIVTMPDRQWSSMFYSKGPSSLIKSDLNATTLMIEQESMIASKVNLDDGHHSVEIK